MSRFDSGSRLERFFTGKGFYIVLFLCASVIGVSAWMLMAGNETMVKDAEDISHAGFGTGEVETVILPPQEEELQPVIKEEEIIIEEAPPVVESGISEPQEEVIQEAEEIVETMEQTEPSYIWPLSGQLERENDGENLKFDPTMQDWRSHEGSDILSSLGCPVEAVRAGTVISAEKDSLYGMTVKLDHGDGTVSIYSNLEEPAAVSAGQFLEAGETLGSVGASAICESSQSSHLHFAIEVNGRNVNPLDYLPA